MSYKMVGVVYTISDTQQVSDKFAKRDIILEDSSSKYPQYIPFQFTQDKVNELDNFAPGMEVEISYNLRGRLWDNPKTGQQQCFSTLEGWKIETVGGIATAPVVQNSAPTIATADDQDLPF